MVVGREDPSRCALQAAPRGLGSLGAECLRRGTKSPELGTPGPAHLHVLPRQPAVFNLLPGGWPEDLRQKRPRGGQQHVFGTISRDVALGARAAPGESGQPGPGARLHPLPSTDLLGLSAGMVKMQQEDVVFGSHHQPGPVFIQQEGLETQPVP